MLLGPIFVLTKSMSGAWGQNCTDNLILFRDALCYLSYPGGLKHFSISGSIFHLFIIAS